MLTVNLIISSTRIVVVMALVAFMTFTAAAIASADAEVQGESCNQEPQRNSYFDGKFLAAADLAEVDVEAESDSSEVQRVSYFDGRFLTAEDLQSEQVYEQEQAIDFKMIVTVASYSEQWFQLSSVYASADKYDSPEC